MNMLGFYTKNFGATGVFEAIRDVRPPVLINELDDKGMLRRIRNELSPDTFVIGRFIILRDLLHETSSGRWRATAGAVVAAKIGVGERGSPEYGLSQVSAV